MRNEVDTPSYVGLLESGELARRVEAAVERLAACDICPRRCGANRLGDERGVCRTGRRAEVASYFPHPGEESCLRGRRGSGTIFFCGCNLLCPFCQNWETSHGCEGVSHRGSEGGSEGGREGCPSGRPVSARRLAEMMLELQDAGCHNINWVTPTHVLPQALEGLLIAAGSGLRLPIVYNTGGYDALQTLALLDGVVDIYMPDFKFWDADVARRILGLADYPEVARAAIREMHRQVGDLIVDERGIARRGLLVRHLVMPGGLAGTEGVLGWLAAEVSRETFVNIMPQYHPAGEVAGADAVAGAGEIMAPGGRECWRDIARPITSAEYREALAAARRAGLVRIDRR